jgi:methionyl-tRNA formyltransferase
MSTGYVLVTSNARGLASVFLDLAIRSADPRCRPLAVILSAGSRPATAPYARLRRRIRKVLRIGILGSLNGVRMRGWYMAEVQAALAAPDLRELCAVSGIPLRQVSGFWDPTAGQALAEFESDVGVSVGNGVMPAQFFLIPRLGMINVHHELLPRYRGAQTAIWQIHDGSRETGFSIHEVTQRIDQGRILLREPLPIIFRRTLHETVVATSVHVQQRSVERLLDVVVDIERYFQDAAPNEGGALHTTPSTRAMLRVYRNHAKFRAANS